MGLFATLREPDKQNVRSFMSEVQSRTGPNGLNYSQQ